MGKLAVKTGKATLSVNAELMNWYLCMFTLVISQSYFFPILTAPIRAQVAKQAGWFLICAPFSLPWLAETTRIFTDRQKWFIHIFNKEALEQTKKKETRSISKTFKTKFLWRWEVSDSLMFYVDQVTILTYLFKDWIACLPWNGNLHHEESYPKGTRSTAQKFMEFFPYLVQSALWMGWVCNNTVMLFVI